MIRVLITGGTGFVGSRLAARLAEQKIETHLYVRPSSDVWRIKHVKSDLFLHEVDLRDAEKVKLSIEKINPDYIFHLACYGGFAHENNAKLIVETNILITQILLEACEKSDKVHIKKFIYIGSSSEYGIKNNPMTEDMREEPNTVYGVSKLAGTHLVQQYGRENIFPTVILRIFSPYGKFDDARRFIPSVIYASLLGETMLLGNGKSVRDFVFVEDLIDAFLKCMSASVGLGEIINLGSGTQRTVKEIAELVLSLSQRKFMLKFNEKPDRMNEPQHWQADITRAKELLNWSPTTKLEQGLSETMRWMQVRLNSHESF